MDNSYTNEPSNYIYAQSQLYADTKSVASYEEIFTPPKYEKEHSYISFNNSPIPRFCFEETVPKKTITFSIPNYVLIILLTTLAFLCFVLVLILTDVIHINSPWKPEIPDIIPYQGEDWFVPVERWGMKHTYKNCPATHQVVTKVSVTQIPIEDQECEDIKACERYLAAYDTNVTVRHRGELEYEFFFGKDKHVFEGRNWNCPYKPGELRLGYLGEEYDPQDLGLAWGNIRYTIIQFGIKNKLVSEEVCYDIDPAKKNCQ